MAENVSPFSEAEGRFYPTYPCAAERIGLIEFLKRRKDGVVVIGADTNARWLLKEFIEGLSDDEDENLPLVKSYGARSCNAMSANIVAKIIQANRIQGAIILVCPGDIYREGKERADNMSLSQNLASVVSKLMARNPQLQVMALFQKDVKPRF